jgi:hypothetical protein
MLVCLVEHDVQLHKIPGALLGQPRTLAPKPTKKFLPNIAHYVCAIYNLKTIIKTLAYLFKTVGFMK